MNQEEMEFVVYMINKCANEWERSPSEIYKILEEHDCIQSFLVNYYDVLHTQSSGYVMEDIREYLLNRGVEI